MTACLVFVAKLDFLPSSPARAPCILFYPCCAGSDAPAQHLDIFFIIISAAPIFRGYLLLISPLVFYLCEQILTMVSFHYTQVKSAMWRFFLIDIGDAALQVLCSEELDTEISI